MESNFAYTLKTNELGCRVLYFNSLKSTREFLKHLLQILGMYNFLVHTKQNIWINGEVYVLLKGVNGEITLQIDRLQQISLVENKGTSGFNKILEILNCHYVFNLEDTPCQKDSILEFLTA